jgi:hypothetical protein
MISMPASQVETRFSNMNAAVAAPVAVAASARVAVTFSQTVNRAEMLLYQAIGAILTFDSGSLTGESAFITITSLRWGSLSVFVPAQIINLPGSFQSVASLLLQGISAQQGDVMAMNMVVVNGDAVNPHNITVQLCTAMHTPVRLTDDIALTQLVDRRAMIEAEALERRIRGQ